MRYTTILTVLGLTAALSPAFGQSKSEHFSEVYVERTEPLQYLGETPALRDMELNLPSIETYIDKDKERKNFMGRFKVGPVLRNENPQFDPLVDRNGMVRSVRVPNSLIIYNQDGIGNTFVQPPDPTIDVGMDYWIQAINGSGSTRYVIKNKTGSTILGPTSMDNLWTSLNTSGAGDPIIMYDRHASRWVITEFSFQNALLVAISTTSDPTGTYHVYKFFTTQFPDYPKYSIWNDGYYVTTNESAPRIYALQRDSMLVGSSNASMQTFQVNNLNSFGFQAVTPVSLNGAAQPAGNSTPTFWRHRDDEAHGPFPANGAEDYIEYWDLTIDWGNSSNSVLSGPVQITVTEFDSDINGYFAFSGIKQPNTSVSLDPLREVFMNRMFYRNFGTHESIVGCHATDVTGNDDAGVRWYELRKSGMGPWSVYQEGTYSPDNHSRWMASIAQDSAGNIALAYNISSSTVFPGLRFTGRSANDPLGQMTLAEQTIVSGSGSNTSNRYGDYSSMSVDPSDEMTFWFTGEYNPSSSWDTRVIAFQLNDTCNGFQISVQVDQTLDCPDDMTGAVSGMANGGTPPYTYSIDGTNFGTSTSFNGLGHGLYNIIARDSVGCEVTSSGLDLTDPDTFNHDITITDPLCFDESNGEIQVVSTGGTGSISYSLDGAIWNGGGSIANLAAGTYDLYVRDANQCYDTVSSIVLTNPDSLSMTYSITPSSVGGSDGEVSLHASGGNPPFLYSVNGSFFQGDSVFTDLAAGSYPALARDQNGCEIQIEVVVYSTGVEGLEANDIPSFFPNPTEKQIRLEVPAAFGDAELAIYDMNGRLIHSIRVNTGSQTITLPPMASGLYTLRLENEDYHLELELIKK